MKKEWRLPFSTVTLTAAFAFAFIGCSDSSSGKTREVGIAAMTCTELMYNPAPGYPEFVELKLTGKSLSSMSAVNLRLDGAVQYSFPDEPLDVDEIIVVTEDASLFREKYPSFTGRLFQWDAGYKLSNSGDVLEIKLDGKGDFDARFDNNPPWPSLADGNGSSLVFIGDNPAYAESWAASKTPNGNPGSIEDPYYAASSVRINEIMPYHGGESKSWIEFYNAGPAEADIGGWKLIRADVKDSVRYIPAGTKIAAEGYVVLDSLESESGNLEAVSFVARGEAVYLREVQAGKVTGVESGLEYAAVLPGHSAGVISLSDETSQQGMLQKPTKGAANSEISLGPLFISEVFYNPLDGDVEFLEIVNNSDSSVTLRTMLNTLFVGWKISGVGFEFGESNVLLPQEVAVLIPTNYTAADGFSSVPVTVEEFRAKWKLPESLQIFQYAGKLSNRGEKISVENPLEIAKNLKDSSVVYYQVSDAILYSDRGLWPEDADGYGYSLHRRDYAVSGYEPSNWDAKEPTPGKI
ncbi:lamin tail domain-containing protein [uncultured Fibrobacter sp.]|uniref:lamin tail domain-containing protein n=1 Tax=uncultured Fibrobacter sp. TaxID=261512 RepID=UPI0025980192|nr:lamin tail domain-containing protein [uncultured Fibrobacter sp.]